MRSLLDGVNRELAEFVLGWGDVLLDVAGLAEIVGLADWHDPQLWNMAKFSFSDELIPLYADHVAALLQDPRQEWKGSDFDLDNTVWGGVIGDDGLEGIQIRRAMRGVRRIWRFSDSIGLAATRNCARPFRRRMPTE